MESENSGVSQNTNRDDPFTRKSRLSRTPPPRDRSKSITSMDEIKKIPSTSHFQFTAAPLTQFQTVPSNKQLPHKNLSAPIHEQNEEWKLQNSHKRDRNSPDNRNVKQTKISDYWLGTPVSTSNRFDCLYIDPEDRADEVTDVRTDKSLKSPPIFIQGVQNIVPLTKLLNEIAKSNYDIKVLNFNQVKIQPKTTECYTTITKALIEKKTEFFTYQLKTERNFRVVLKGMHYSTDISELKAALEEQGHQVQNLWNIKHFKSKIPLPMFFVDLKPANNNKQVYDLQYLLHHKIRIEPPHQKRDIPQCSRCQRYGHTKKYCHLKPRCVKCTGDHATENCPRKERSDSVKCVLCSGNHPANYKGCAVYKELQQKKYPALRPMQNPARTRSISGQNIQPGHSYAQVTTKNDPMQETAMKQQQEVMPQNTSQAANSTYIPNTNDMFELKSMMKVIMEQMGTMLNLLTVLLTKLSK